MRKLECRREGKRAPATGRALDLECAAHDLHEPAADREPEPEPAEAPRHRRVDLRERLEERRHVFRRDADAGVGDREPQLGPVAPQLREGDSHDDFPSLRELQSVREQIQQYLLEADRIAAQLARHVDRRLEEDLEILAGGPNRDDVREVRQLVVEVELDPLDLEPSRLDPREVEDVLDDLREKPCRAADLLELIAELRRDLALEGERRHADDRVERGSDLVAHVREELALRLVRRLGLVLRVP